MSLSPNLSFIEEAIDQDHISDPRFQDIFSYIAKGVAGLSVEFIQAADETSVSIDGEKLIINTNTKDTSTITRAVQQIDNNTFANDIRSSEGINRLRRYSRRFINSSRLLNEYLDYKKCNSALTDLSDDFIETVTQLSQSLEVYGLNIISQEAKSNDQSSVLSEIEKRELDSWLFGYDTTQNRQYREEASPYESSGGFLDHVNPRDLKRIYEIYGGSTENAYDQTEETVNDISRYKRIDAFFKIFLKESNESSPLQEKIKFQIKRAINQPMMSLYSSVFRAGEQELLNMGTNEVMLQRMQSKIGGESFSGVDGLYECLKIDDKKSELQQVRNTGNVEKISEKELEIAKEVWRAVSSYTYVHDTESYLASSMKEKQVFNCVGSTKLGGALLNELGIKYLHANSPGHTLSVLVLSNNKMYLQDFTPGNFPEAEDGTTDNYTEITPDLLVEGSDVSNLIERTKSEGVQLEFKSWNPYNDVYGKLTLDVIHPRLGKQSDVLWNTANHVFREEKNEELSLYIYELCLLFDSDDKTKFYVVAEDMFRANKINQALHYTKTLLSKYPNFIHGHILLSKIYKSRGQEDKAEQFIDSMLTIKPRNLIEFRIQCEYHTKAGSHDALETSLQDMYIGTSSPWDLYEIVGQEYETVGDFEKAHEYYNKINESTTYNPAGHILKGDLYFRQELYSLAAEQFKMSLKRNPYLEQPLYSLMLIYRHLDLTTEVLETLEIYTDRFSSHGMLHQEVSEIHNGYKMNEASQAAQQM